MTGQLAVLVLVALLVVSTLFSPRQEGLPGAGVFAIVGQPAPPFTCAAREENGGSPITWENP